jgi:CDP-diglyceride synthetase
MVMFMFMVMAITCQIMFMIMYMIIVSFESKSTRLKVVIPGQRGLVWPEDRGILGQWCSFT